MCVICGIVNFKKHIKDENQLLDMMRAMFARHVKGEINIAREIWKWINLELWFREYMEG